MPHGEGLSPEQVCPVSLSQAEMEAMYKHCRQVSHGNNVNLVNKISNVFQGLWPLFHSMADRAVFDEEHWAEYHRCSIFSTFM